MSWWLFCGAAMSYQVLWSSDAEALLTEIWLLSDDRERVNNAVYDLEKKLKSNPEDAGESRESDDRIAFAPPLAVHFRVFVSDLTVKVLKVWRY
jgi:hypothetical protein